MEVTKGKYEREELFDSELQKIFGDRYQDLTVQPAEESADDTCVTGFFWRRIKASAGLVLGDGLLLYMLMSGKIDDLFGVLFVAGVSAVCGYYLK